MTTAWWQPGDITVYRFLKHSAWWSPTDPFRDPDGRFGSTSRFTLYVSESATAATAEFFRRNPTLLSLQDRSRIRIFEVRLSVGGNCADVRTPALAAAANIGFDRLTSNEADIQVRYADCHALADDVEARGGCGVAYPSAALLVPGTWNLVTFGQAGPSWSVVSAVEISRPHVDPSRVQVAPPPP